MARKNTVTRFIEDIVDNTKDFVDDVVDRAKDVETDVCKAAKNVVSDDEDETTVGSASLDELNAAIAELTKKVGELAKAAK